MIFNLCGGGLLPNYKIVGSLTEPTELCKNTIWVETSETITNHVFSDVEPANPTNGLVWILTSDLSENGIKLVSNNPIIVYPLRVRLYKDDEWVSCESSLYYDSTWHTLWSGYLYTPGSKIPAFLGSITARPIPYASTYTAAAPYLNQNYGANGYGCLRIYHNTPSGVSRSGIFAFTNPIDLTLYKKLKVTCAVYLETNTAEPNPHVCICVWRRFPESDYMTYAVAYHMITEGDADLTAASLNVYELDISALSTDCYIGIGITGCNAEAHVVGIELV